MDERYLSFYARMSTRVDELRTLHMGLYHDPDAFISFCDTLRTSLDHRRDNLRQLDHDRE